MRSHFRLRVQRKIDALGNRKLQDPSAFENDVTVRVLRDTRQLAADWRSRFGELAKQARQLTCRSLPGLLERFDCVPRRLDLLALGHYWIGVLSTFRMHLLASHRFAPGSKKRTRRDGKSFVPAKTQRT